jgi:hypothetical protein
MEDGVSEAEEFRILLDYLVSGRYPEEYTKEQKRRLREKSKPFRVEKGELQHKNQKGVFVRVIVDLVERDRVVSSMHEGLGGAHFGQAATVRKVI